MAYRKDLERNAAAMMKVKNPLQSSFENGEGGDPPKMKNYVLTGVTVDAPVNVPISKSTKQKSNFGPTTVTPASPNPGIIKEQSPESVVLNWEKGPAGSSITKAGEEKIDYDRNLDGGPTTIQSVANRSFRNKLKQKAKKMLNK
tara:strand:- start:36 stop:467 length:432 start_codon:yes stop_codon:yes gene_type:complete